jgi:hypothetical protein
MSTFTNVLQQRINALQNQIRNLHEQNNRLRRRARYLLEAAPSTDMLMVPTADTQTPSQGPLGQAPSQDRYTSSTETYRPANPWNPGEYNDPYGDHDGDGVPNHRDQDYIFKPGRTPDGTYTNPDTGITYTLSGNTLTITSRDGRTWVLNWNPQTNQWEEGTYRPF